MKKNKSIKSEFNKGLKAENKATKIFLKAFILEIVLKGLKTLKDLKADKSTPS